jgi:hypothetical protein
LANETIKVWTTIDKNLRNELKAISKEMGFRSENDCLREAIRLGAKDLQAQLSISSTLPKRKDSILSAGGLMSEEYERMKPNELELKTGAKWRAKKIVRMPPLTFIDARFEKFNSHVASEGSSSGIAGLGF